jgi:hypothetical protein
MFSPAFLASSVPMLGNQFQAQLLQKTTDQMRFRTDTDLLIRHGSTVCRVHESGISDEVL